MSVTVIVATYGDKDRWDRISMRALLSAEGQTRIPDDIIRAHGDTLHGARNAAAIAAKTEWLCFLDADDELHPEYIEAMECADGDLRYPMMQTVVNGIDVDSPKDLANHDLIQGNFMVIGTFVRRNQFLRVGGFSNIPVYDDWELWLKCVLMGDSAKLVPAAIYRMHDVPGSRNKNIELSTMYWPLIRSRYFDGTLMTSDYW